MFNKKQFLVLALASSSILVVQSCKKMDGDKDHQDKIEYRTVEATINANETYTYSMPENTSDDAFEITTQASHYKTSSLENNATTYRYTPVTDYIGSDKVVISTVEEQHNGHHSGGGGNCFGGQHHDKDETELVITINLTIKAVSIK